MKKILFSIFIPVYNEEKNIDEILGKVLEVVKSMECDYEILFINDGSTDRSGKKIQSWIQKKYNIRLINHQANFGYGTALRTGFKNAIGDLIFYTDADMPVSLDEIKKVIPLMEECDLAIGYRINREDIFRRFVYSKIYNILLRMLLGVKVKDANFSFKCIRKEALAKCNLTAKSVFIDGELLAEAVRNNLTIKEVPLYYIVRRHGRSNFDSLNAAVFTLREIIAYWLFVRITKSRKG